jgi:ribulose-phosphate 3-epimerase
MTASRRILIAPSILSADFARLGEQVRAAEAAGADLIHVDVMDGHFVPNISVGPLVVRALRPVTHLPLDVHLMIAQPERYIDEFARAGADIIKVHVETCPHLERTLQQIREAGARPGVTLNPATPLMLLEEVLDQVEVVLVMTVNPGFGGQKLIPATLDKVRRLRQTLDARGLACAIQVDGGVNAQTAASVVRAGADVLVVGAAVFANGEGIEAAMRALRGAAEEGLQAGA